MLYAAIVLWCHMMGLPTWFYQIIDHRAKGGGRVDDYIRNFSCLYHHKRLATWGEALSYINSRLQRGFQSQRERTYGGDPARIAAHADQIKVYATIWLIGGLAAKTVWGDHHPLLYCVGMGRRR